MFSYDFYAFHYFELTGNHQSAYIFIAFERLPMRAILNTEEILCFYMISCIAHIWKMRMSKTYGFFNI